MGLSPLPAGTSVLLVSGSPEISADLTARLGECEVIQAFDVHAAAAVFDDRTPRLIVFHWSALRGRTASEVCRTLRQGSPILALLDAESDAETRIEAFESGADECAPIDCTPRELMVRLAVLLRRGHGSRRRRQFRRGNLVIDLSSRSASFDGKVLPLTPYEFGLLSVLAEDANHVMSREELMERAKGSVDESFDRSIDVHICRLRAKLGTPLLQTVRGVGYVLRSSGEGTT